MPKKRSRSRSRERDREDRKTSKKLKLMQEQIDNLTKCVTDFIQSQKEDNNSAEGGHSHKRARFNKNQLVQVQKVPNVIESNKEIIPEPSHNDSDKSSNTTDMDTITRSEEDIQCPQDWNQEFLEIMGEELPSISTIKVDETIQKQWTQWMKKGLTDETRKDLLKKYNREGTFRTEAPKVNLEIVSHLTEIAKKRDQHFIDTQNCVGSGLISLGAAISMLMENPEDGIDHMQLMKYLWDSGKCLSDIYNQQSVGRKSFITPTLDKDIKSTLEAADSDEWLYGTKLNDLVKDAKNIKKASASLKASGKPPTKKVNEGNWRGPPIKARQVGYFPRRQFTNVRFKPNRPFQTRPSQNPGRPMTQKQNRPALRK